MTDANGGKKPLPRGLDGTINLPTLLALLGFMVAQGFLPGAGAPEAAIEDAVDVHSAVPHEGAVLRATYDLEKAHDRETMARIEEKLDVLSEEVRELSR
tara:strand:+ start:91 stop:387 length:297 start_codon:yes stop_codon:yes gene_type:complete